MSPGKGCRAVSMGLDGMPGANPWLQLGMRVLRRWREGHPGVCIQGLGLLPWTISVRKAQITHLGCLVGQVPWQNHFKSIGLLENMSSGLSFSSWFHHACVTPCVLLLLITVAISVGPEGMGRLSLCPASPHLLSCWGDQQDLAARDPWVFLKQCGAGRLGSFALLLFLLLLFFPPNSGSADPQMLLMEILPVYMLILSSLTSGLLFSWLLTVLSPVESRCHGLRG